MLISQETKYLMRNIGFDVSYFNNIKENQTAFVLKREKIRKVNSESAVIKIEKKDVQIRRIREEEDFETYKEMEDEELFQEKADYRTFYEESNCLGHDEEVAEDSPIENPLHADPSLNKDLDVFANCSKSQMNQLDRIVKEMNSGKDEKVLVKAYKSKLKSKFYQIYEENSQLFKEKIKYKIFHKCNFPSCGRTFASSGWLKSHFQEHLKELKKNKFNILFEELILNCKPCYINN